MIGGFERYFQIARCFRDEDLRADRQPEFTQLDVEMSFVVEDDVIAITESVMAAVFDGRRTSRSPPPPWPRMSYDEAMARFGSDRPDTRFGLEIHDVSEHLRGCEFKVFESVLDARRRRPRAQRRRTRASRARSSTGSTTSSALRRQGASRRSPVGASGAWGSNLAKFFSARAGTAPSTPRCGAGEGDLLLFVADRARGRAGGARRAAAASSASASG